MTTRWKPLALVLCALIISPALWASSYKISKARRLHDDKKWRKAAELVDQVLEKNPKNYQALVLRGEIALDERDLVRAERLLKKAHNLRPNQAKPPYYLGYVYLLQRKYDGAMDCADKARKAGKNWHKVHVLTTWIHIRRRHMTRAHQSVEKALKLNGKDPLVRTARAYVHYRFGKGKKARREYQLALRLDPWTEKSHQMLGQGLGPDSDNKKLKRSSSSRRYLIRALKYMDKGDYDKARRYLARLFRAHPNNATLHFLIGLSLRQERLLRHRVHSIPAFQKLSEYPWAPSLPEKYMAEIFPLYPKLKPWEKRVLHWSVAPFRKYLPKLARKNIVHHLLPRHTRLSELPGKGYTANKYTGDGRRGGDLRGVTEKNAISGRETLWNARIFSFNTVAHEFAHQVHLYGFSQSQKDRIDELYKKAKKEKRFLDYYAAFNPREYFAQGYEAFVSRYKRPGLGMTAHHTRDELKKRDPGLYQFLLEVTEPVVSPKTLAKIYRHVEETYLKLEEKDLAKQARDLAARLEKGTVKRD